MGTRREKLMQKLNPKLLKMTPKLSGNEGSFIDLDCDDSLEDGARNLMMRFFRNQDLCERNKRNLEKNVTELTVSTAKRNENNEICELISEKLSLPFMPNDEDEVYERPGRRLQKLKMELQEKMSAKWEEEYKKRVNENKIGYEAKHHQKKCSDDDEDDGDEAEKDNSDDEEDVDKDNSDDDSDSDSKIENITDAADSDTKDVIESHLENDNEYEGDEEDFESDGASVTSDEQNNCGNDQDKLEKVDSFDDTDTCSLIPAYQPGGGMLYGGSELTQCDDGLPQNLLSPSLRLSMYELSASKASSEFQDATPKEAEFSPNEEVNNSFVKSNKLFSQAPNDSFDLNEAFEFCSGKFPDAENEFGSQLVEEKLQGSDEEEDKIDEGDETEHSDDDGGGGSEDKTTNSSGDEDPPTADSFGKETSKARRNIIAFEDSEEEEEELVKKDTLLEEAEESQPAGSKLLSDDEDEGTARNPEMKKKNKKIKNLHFSDEEDATSDCEDENAGGDPDDSGKEDDDIGENCEEKSVHYDSEENEIINPKEFFDKEAELSGEEWSGDEDERGLDEFDVEEGDADKIDDDQVRSQLEKIHIRRVLDDDAREVRLIQEILFEDGDLHSNGKRRDRKFKWKNLGTFNEEGNEGESKEEGGNSSEDDGAEEEELRKIRHEKELFLMTKKKEGDLSSDEEIVEDFHTIKVTSVKNSIKVVTRTESAVECTKTITDYTGLGKIANLSNARGSFLTRNEEFLSRLAKATSGATDNVLGPKSSKNFVFTTKSPEKTNPDRTTAWKRQVEDSENCGSREKKIKLFPPKIDTGPSILDLLA